MNIKNFKKSNLPDKPGVYFFLKTSPKPSPERRGGHFPFQGKAGDEVLYIGKATSLRDRVKSYFGKDLISTRGPVILDMVWKADKIDWQATDSVLEALILEANLIKKHQPRYNTKEKSDKSFNFVCITDEKLPKVIVKRGKGLNHQNFKKVFGPYPNGSQLREAMKIIRRIFTFLDDKSKNYLEFYRQINLVPDLNDRKLYLQNIRNIILFFSGKKQKIVRNLKKEMKEYAKRHEFEKAGEIKRQLFALQHINDVALLKNERQYASPGNSFVQSLGPSLRSATPSQKYFPAPLRIEAYDIAHLFGKNMVGVMVVIENGEADKNEYRKFSARGGSAFGGKTILGDTKSNDTGALKEVLERRLAHQEWAYPNLIVLDGGVAQLNAGKSVLKKFNLKIPIVSVVKDERHQPKAIMGDEKIIAEHKKSILLGNSEAHRFAIAYHKRSRAKSFLP